MQTIFVTLRQVTSNGKLLENILETESTFKETVAELAHYWTGHEGYQNVKATTKTVECSVLNGVIYLPSAVYFNYFKTQYIPSHWNVTEAR